MNKSVARQIVGAAQRRADGQQLRAAGRKHLVCEQQLDIEPRIFAAAVADRDIKIAPGQIDDLVGGGDPHIDLGVLLLKPVQAQHQPFGGNRRRSGDGQRPGVVVRAQPADRDWMPAKASDRPGNSMRADAVSSIARFMR